jgi:hypothetical protein
MNNTAVAATIKGKMMEFIIAFVVFLLVVIGMAAGVLVGRKQIQGSCGGLAHLGIEKSCDCEEVCDEHRTLYQIQEPNDSLNPK